MDKWLENRIKSCGSGLGKTDKDTIEQLWGLIQDLIKEINRLEER